jgi:excinuclease ABC subunit C
MEKLLNEEYLKDLKFKDFRSLFQDTRGKGGVYRLLGENDKLLYIGKAKSLNGRIKNHLSGLTNTGEFYTEIKKVECLILENSLHRHMLEAVLIAYYKPKYNSEVIEFILENSEEMPHLRKYYERKYIKKLIRKRGN